MDRPARPTINGNMSDSEIKEQIELIKASRRTRRQRLQDLLREYP